LAVAVLEVLALLELTDKIPFLTLQLLAHLQGELLLLVEAVVGQGNRV
jgi:hypothetical protein